MRRESLIESDSHTPIYGELIFDAPLSYGDLTDHISGNSAVYGSGINGTVNWDNSLKAYHFYKQASNGQACYWQDLNLNIATSSNKVTSSLCVEFDVFSYLDPLGNSTWNGENIWRRGVVLGAWTSTSQNTFWIPVDWKVYDTSAPGCAAAAGVWQHIVAININQQNTTYVDNRVFTDASATIGSNAGSRNNSFISTYVSIGKLNNNLIDAYFKNIKIYKLD